MKRDESVEVGEPSLLTRLEAFARQAETEETVLPWAARLSRQDRARLRGDLLVVLEEPAHTGEPVDWREIGDILQEWAEIAGWDGVLVHSDGGTPSGPFTVVLRPRDHEALAGASSAVQKAMEQLLAEFLPQYPTASHLLPRGRLRKMPDRDVWQLQLPDGYRLRYAVDKDERLVHVVYLGPHPDRDTRGRERAVRVTVKRVARDGRRQPG